MLRVDRKVVCGAEEGGGEGSAAFLIVGNRIFKSPDFL